MHYTQNDKIAQVGHDSLVIGVDVGSEKQHARAFGPMQNEPVPWFFVLATRICFRRLIKSQCDNLEPSLHSVTNTVYTDE